MEIIILTCTCKYCLLFRAVKSQVDIISFQFSVFFLAETFLFYMKLSQKSKIKSFSSLEIPFVPKEEHFSRDISVSVIDTGRGNCERFN